MVSGVNSTLQCVCIGEGVAPLGSFLVWLNRHKQTCRVVIHPKQNMVFVSVISFFITGIKWLTTNRNAISINKDQTEVCFQQQREYFVFPPSTCRTKPRSAWS